MIGISNINQLPNEILFNVFSKIGLNAFSLSSTCRRWNEVLNSGHSISHFVHAVISTTIPAGIPDLRDWLKSRTTGDCYDDGAITDVKIIDKYLVSTSLNSESIRIHDLTNMTAPLGILPICVPRWKSAKPKIHIESYKNLLIVGSNEDGTIKFIDLETRKEIDQIKTSMGLIDYLKICENFLIVAYFNIVKVFDVTTKNEIFKKEYIYSEFKNASISGSYIMLRFKTKYKLEDQLIVFKLDNNIISSINLICHDSSQVKLDGSCLVVGSFDQTSNIGVYNLENGQIIKKENWLKDYEYAFQTPVLVVAKRLFQLLKTLKSPLPH